MAKQVRERTFGPQPRRTRRHKTDGTKHRKRLGNKKKRKDHGT